MHPMPSYRRNPQGKLSRVMREMIGDGWCMSLIPYSSYRRLCMEYGVRSTLLSLIVSRPAACAVLEANGPHGAFIWA